MKKQFSTPGLLTIAILTIITAVFWTFFSVLRVFMDKPGVEIPGEILEPVNPTLNKEALIQIKEKKFIDEAQLPNIIYQEAIEEVVQESEEGEELVGEELPESSPTPASVATDEGELIP